MAPALLEEILGGLPPQFSDPALLVGPESRDDAAVYRLDDDKAVVATADFFTPIVDDPFEFGRIAGANALSDVYSVGARPLFALALAGMPLNQVPVETIGRILAGGAATCEVAGIAIGGGHTIDSAEPFYGLAAIGLVDPARIKRNNAAQVGDVLILGKPLGIGILCAALKADKLSGPAYDEMLATATLLNSIGTTLGGLDGVHAMTDVTGFGLAGHLMELCRGVSLAAEIDFARVPVLETALPLAREGVNTGAGRRNWTSWEEAVTLPGGFAEWQRNLLCDPQTNGGLLLAAQPEEAERILDLFAEDGHTGAAVIGEMAAGAPGIRVT